MHLLHTILILLLVVSGTRIATQFVPLPLPLLQILIGALLALPWLGLHVRLEPELFLLLFVPPLLFVDGWRMPKGQFRRLRTPILSLAFALVFFTILGAGYFIHWLLPQVPLAACFALAAVLSPTDAVAVSAITHGRLPATLNNLLQGEALMNDASGLVAFKFAVAAALTGVFSLGDASLQFVLVAVGGLLVGLALSSLLGRLRAWLIGHGVRVYSPITHTHPIAHYGGLDPLDLDLWLRVDKPFMQHACGMIVLELRGWRLSKGIKAEVAEFARMGKPIHYMRWPIY